MNRERGFALISAIVLAALYFALVELLLLDSSRELAEARRFKAKVVAATLAENAAELAAVEITDPARSAFEAKGADGFGEMKGSMKKNAAGEFQIVAEGESAGVVQAKATVRVYGRVKGSRVEIDYTIHSQ